MILKRSSQILSRKFDNLAIFKDVSALSEYLHKDACCKHFRHWKHPLILQISMNNLEKITQEILQLSLILAIAI